MEQVPEGQRAPRPLILLVEDDSPVRRAAHMLLLSHGYDVQAHASPAHALADDIARSASCLIAGLAMSEIDALSLLARLRALGWTRPAILIGARLTESAHANARAAGYDIVLPKPVPGYRLLQSVDALVRPSHRSSDGG